MICTLLIGCEAAESGSDDASPVNVPDGARIRAVTLDARDVPSDSLLRAIRDLGATHLTLVSFGFQPAADVPRIRFSPDVDWYSESAAGARDLSQKAKSLGMGIILKPQIWLDGGAWTADIGFDSKAAWQKWESDYRSFLMYTASLARDVDADMLVVGTELSNPVKERPGFWRRLITDIRKEYSGKLTYGANWHDDYDRVPFWDALDVIGVQAYFPITVRDDPSLAELRDGWRDHVAELAQLSRTEERPVLFTEIGYRSVAYAAREPWRWPSREESAPPDFALQADLFRAFFDAVWPKPWFAGAMIWKYSPRTERRMLDFTPQGKPAEDVIREGFGSD